MGDSDLTDWARQEAVRLRAVARAGNVPEAYKATVQARQFLSEFAAGSTFQDAAEEAVRSYQRFSPGPFTEVAGVLDDWVAYQESGIANLKPFEVRFRIEAATDLMEQVQILLKDSGVVPAAL